jgi:hypothetical protein
LYTADPRTPASASSGTSREGRRVSDSWALVFFAVFADGGEFGPMLTDPLFDL